MSDEVARISESIKRLDTGHSPEGLDESDLDSDPIAQFARWMEAALEAGIELPNAMSLATADAEGRPSARMVLLRGFDRRGFCFYSNYESRKARELDQNPYGALVFYWGPLERQVRIAGRVSKLGAEESDAYWSSRSRASRLSAWASSQTEVIANRAELEAAVAAAGARFEGADVPRPHFWGGYRLEPDLVEFWQGRSNRLHDRLSYRRVPEIGWLIERLSP